MVAMPHSILSGVSFDTRRNPDIRRIILSPRTVDSLEKEKTMKTTEYRPGSKIERKQDGKTYTVDAIAKKAEDGDERIVVFHETDHYDEGVVYMTIREFNKFIGI